MPQIPRLGAATLVMLLSPAAVSEQGRALGHEWYDKLCCEDRDCRPLPPDAAVRAELGGYSVLVAPGRRVFFHRDKVRTSPDSRYHACISPTGTPFCIYVPLNS